MKNINLINYGFRIAFSLVLLLGLTVSCNNDGGRGSRPGLNASALKTQLNLTDDQTQKVEQIIETTRNEMRELRESSSGDWREMREGMMTIRNKQNEQIEALLTEEQKKLWEEFKKERQDRFERRRQGEGGEQRNP